MPFVFLVALCCFMLPPALFIFFPGWLSHSKNWTTIFLFSLIPAICSIGMALGLGEFTFINLMFLAPSISLLIYWSILVVFFNWFHRLPIHFDDLERNSAGEDLEDRAFNILVFTAMFIVPLLIWPAAISIRF